MKRIGKRSRLVGAGVAGTKGGDACVALVLLHHRITFATMGDASVPSPHNPTPAPTGTKRLPKGYHKKPTRESPTPVPTNVTICLKKPTPVNSAPAPTDMMICPQKTSPCKHDGRPDDLDQVQALAEPQPGDQEGEDNLCCGLEDEQGNLQVHQLCALLPQLSLERLIIGDGS
jgi:hypothetical protein